MFPSLHRCPTSLRARVLPLDTFPQPVTQTQQAHAKDGNSQDGGASCRHLCKLPIMAPLLRPNADVDRIGQDGGTVVTRALAKFFIQRLLDSRSLLLRHVGNQSCSWDCRLSQNPTDVFRTGTPFSR